LRSFRDPEGFCWSDTNHVYRMVYPTARERVLAFHYSDFRRSLESRRLLPSTRLLSTEEVDQLTPPDSYPLAGNVVLEHERIAFPSYAHEWSPAMLFAAGSLTLELQLQALEAGLTLKDATPSNILFRGSSPVFVDYLSFETRPPHQVLWMAYGQFVRTFVLPLLAYRLCGTLPHEHFFARRDGLEPEALLRSLSFFQRFSGHALRFVTLPSMLGKSRAATAPTTSPAAGTVDAEKNDYVSRSLITSLITSFKQLAPSQTNSRWSGYMSCHNYDKEAFIAKEAFVRTALLELQPKTVLDVGCNTGHFSELAAGLGAAVVAIDYDTAALDEVWRSSASKSANIQPLVVNLAWPTPAQGWRNQEQRSFLDRAAGQFDVMLLLAVIHHLSVTDGIPLDDIFRLVSETVTVGAIAEFVSPEDSMMQELLRNKTHLAPRLTQTAFESALQPWFEIVRQTTRSDGRRSLYLLKRRAS